MLGDQIVCVMRTYVHECGSVTGVVLLRVWFCYGCGSVTGGVLLWVWFYYGCGSSTNICHALFLTVNWPYFLVGGVGRVYILNASLPGSHLHSELELPSYNLTEISTHYRSQLIVWLDFNVS